MNCNDAESGKGVLTCLHPDCLAEIQARGLCTRHLQEARRMLARKEATEKELVARGMILAPYAGHREMRAWLQQSRAADPEAGRKVRTPSRPG